MAKSAKGSEKLFSGVIPPIITPLTQERSLDVEALDALIDFLIGQGVSGIFVGGTSGEACYLSAPDQKRLYERCIERTAGRIPVLCGVIEPSTTRVVERIKALEQIGATIFVATPAFYLQNSCQDEILRHYEAVSRATKHWVAAYNIPATTHVNILPETAAKLNRYDNLVLYKDSCASFEQIQRNIYLLRDTHISLFNGAEEICAASMAFGAQGCVPGLANFFPKLFIDCCESARLGNLAEAALLQEKIYRIRKSLNIGSHWMSCMKYLASKYGFGEGGVSLPLEQLTQSQKNEIDRILIEEQL
ncbi:dihydrodipicolinate synthase family protein [Eubacteriales bacterium OttesenSCG-928-N13]|nr:dihydrodipicolinate synthase family protein [Eubacteriales bacterium OttesenSCG-928-N13]